MMAKSWGFPLLPCDAPSVPQTWADWEAEYTAMDQVRESNVTLYVGEPVEHYRLLTRECDELGVMSNNEVRTSEMGPWLTREFEYDYDLTEGWFTRTGPDGVETFVQRDVGNRVEFVRRGPDGAPLMTASYTYYDNGLIHTVTYGNGAVIEYTYDDANRLSTIDHRDGGGLTMLKLTYDYDRRDLPTFITEEHYDGPTVFVEFAYDDRGRLYHESRDGAAGYDLWYEYDNGGNRTRKVDGLSDVEVVYHYDLEDPELYESANNRLTYYEVFDNSGGAPVLVSTSWYYYNGVGNVTRVVSHAEGTEEYSGTRLVYGVNGSAVSYVAGETWTWDGASPCPANYDIGYAREFRYDGGRQRYLNRELDAGELEQYGLLISISETWSDYDGDSIYGDFSVDGSTVSSVAAFEPGLAHSSAPGNPGATHYCHTDHLGSTRLLSDNAGVPISPTMYTAFGELTVGDNHRYGYAGAWGYQWHDIFSYLHVGARYYDPTSGRFLQRDPIGFEGGFNVYAYVRSAPTVFVDPNGLQQAPGGPFAPGPEHPPGPGGWRTGPRTPRRLPKGTPRPWRPPAVRPPSWRLPPMGPPQIAACAVVAVAGAVAGRLIDNGFAKANHDISISDGLADLLYHWFWDDGSDYDPWGLY